MCRFERGLRPRNRSWGEVRKGGDAPLRGNYALGILLGAVAVVAFVLTR